MKLIWDAVRNQWRPEEDWQRDRPKPPWRSIKDSPRPQPVWWRRALQKDENDKNEGQ